MAGHAKRRILLSAGLVLAAVCAVVALRVMRGIRTSPKPAEQATSLAPPIEVKPVVAAAPPQRVRVATSSVHLKPQPDTGKQHNKVVVERIITDEDFRRLPVSHLPDRCGGVGVYNTWGVLRQRDLDRAGSLERALRGIPGIVFRQTDLP
jgi:hypothetical protein